ncbi:hypothetical protein HK405_001362, partial [Cladochytrium tenue]
GKKIYDLDEFDELQSNYHKFVQSKLSFYHKTIVDTLEQIYTIFKQDGRDVQSQWVKFVHKTDLMVEDSLRFTVKKSLLEVSKAINGEAKSREGTAEIQPLFKLNVVLDAQKVDFSPTLQKLDDTVNKVAQEMLRSIYIVPRLSDVLNTGSAGANSFLDVIANEDDVIKSFVSIQKGLASNSTKCQAYLQIWDPYKEIWEVNKDAFIRRYAKHKPALSTFDADINRYSE